MQYGQFGSQEIARDVRYRQVARIYVDNKDIGSDLGYICRLLGYMKVARTGRQLGQVGSQDIGRLLGYRQVARIWVGCYDIGRQVGQRQVAMIQVGTQDIGSQLGYRQAARIQVDRLVAMIKVGCMFTGFLPGFLWQVWLNENMEDFLSDRNFTPPSALYLTDNE